jgi:hypothetical protein
VAVLLLDVAVGKTPGEPAGSPVRVGSKNGHLVRHTLAVRHVDVVHGGAEVHLRKRAACFLERLYPTATDATSCARDACCSTEAGATSGSIQPRRHLRFVRSA